MANSFRINNNGHCKSTNRLDDILQLTENGRRHIPQIHAGNESDIHFWRWVWFCSGEGSCQRSCGGFGECVNECNHYSDQHNSKNPFDMHKCSVRILTKVMLSEIDTEFPVCMTIKGIHVPQNIIQETTALSRINLNRETRDLAIKSHQADKHTTKEIKMKLLAAYNNALQMNWNQACDFGSFCFGIDGKYDLNHDNAPTLSLVVEDNAGFGMPIAFGVSNKENNHTIRLTVEAVQRNISCSNNYCTHEYHYVELVNNTGFMRIRQCSQLSLWKPFAMINKHRSSKRGLQPILCGVILCWFHIMQTLSEHFKDLRLDDYYRYPIAIAFKIVGQSRSKKEALELGEAYKSFIKSLPLMEITKNLLCAKPMTTNNLTEHMNKPIEGQRVGTQPINSFIEKLYGITLIRDNIIEETSPQFVFEAGQTAEGGFDTYFYVKKGNSEFRSPYNMRKISIDNESFKLLQPMHNKLASKHPIMQQYDYYLVNISTEECTCLDFIWNGSFRNICKHVHAARLFNDIENNKITLDSVKNDLVLYFRNKERAMPKEQKNLIIYSNSVDAAYKEILRSYMVQGNDIFFPYERGVTEKDPFRPVEMPTRRIRDVSTPKTHRAKPRKSISFTLDKENHIIDDDPMTLNNEIELSLASESDKALTNDQKDQSDSLAPSIQRRITAAVHNHKRNISKNKFTQNSINVKSNTKAITRSKLENLFSEKRTD
ncbi:proteophosphoglycan ppg4 [Gigaspora margarita]|uniref:Proteophosphoglycan ppg4 n=1 Tax=Gigaspora margarita TaxID=4874 RepID=A0A8H4EJC7_GIGMA|nr:proteophosphoglycan ppg4 [Gigaspora margarita]